MFKMMKPILLGAALLAGAGAPAIAADYYEPPIVEAPPVFGGWYIRGYIGMSNQQVDELDNVLFDTTDVLDVLDEGDFDSGVIFGAGIGYETSYWLRGDLTAEYRGKTGFSALDRYETIDDGDPTTFDGSNDYSAKKSEWLFLANAYADLGEWYRISPYVGAGIGASRISIHDFRDVNEATGGVAYAEDNSEWNLAWALHAGLGFRVTDNVTLDLGYSFVHLGDGESGDIIASDGTNTVDNPMEFNDITSHDLKFGLRYAFY